MNRKRLEEIKATCHDLLKTKPGAVIGPGAVAELIDAILDEGKVLITIDLLENSKPGAILAKGEALDSPGAMNLAGTGRTVRWVAVRGRGWGDWAIYAQNPHYLATDDPGVVAAGYSGIWDWMKIVREGDKVLIRENIKHLVDVDGEEVWKRYRE